ncbi:thymidine phosphorylase [Persicimonas caeni]|uniref:Thymidine phosphorylase n=1 Tax=Persicimonas caeni TaxID=2292766 RepID=A0A4Y6PTF9_PERCE|nr:thymidine phosphorylase [Persicimonas caeni]QDG51065.1 thymidine phosphorylase [Persicimonas caeni]QED32286.1 thymidine phosphorylase [Persicimonas caeni]
MHVPELIRRKRDGEKLSADELRALIKGYTDGDIPDYQMAAFAMAVYFQSMDSDELGAWTDAMLRSGEVLDLSDIRGVKVDKHSTGGVGDKVSLILAPLAVAAGLKVPMISGRGLGHTGGTLDKLESIPGFDVNQPVGEFRRLVDDIGLGLIGQTGEIAPADKKLYALRDVTATVECIPLIASSIMSKKLAEGIDALVLDVKVGSGAFMKDVDNARKLGETMIGIGQAMGTEVRALITDMDQPLGLAVGNTLEVVESIATLRGEGPEDLTEITVELVCEMLDAADKVDDRDYTKKMLYELLQDGSALHVFREIIEAQGGNPEVCDDPTIMGVADHVVTFGAPKAGVIEHMNAEQVGLAALELGAGRHTKEDDIDPAVGLVFRKKRGETVEKDEPILEIHHNGKGLKDCVARLEKAIRIGDGPADDKPLIIERLG